MQSCPATQTFRDGEGTNIHVSWFWAMRCNNRPFAHLLPGLETGHPVTVGQSPAYELHSEQFETETRKTAFCSSETRKSYGGDWSTVIGCHVSNPGYNCANGLLWDNSLQRYWSATGPDWTLSRWALNSISNTVALKSIFLFFFFQPSHPGLLNVGGSGQRKKLFLCPLPPTECKYGLMQWNWFSGCTWVTCMSDVREAISLHQAVLIRVVR